MINPSKRIRMEDFARFFQFAANEDDSDHEEPDDDNDVVIIPGVEQAKTKDKEERKAEAVEKPMEDRDLIPFYNRYILLMKDYKQQKKSCTDEQLHEYLTDLFNSLQYKNDESDGNNQHSFEFFFEIFSSRSINLSQLSNLFS